MTKPINKITENEIESSEELLQEQEIETTPEELEEVQSNKKPKKVPPLPIQTIVIPAKKV
ncbi:MAG: hypothetical protein LBV69_03370 [Bacteroidales bacterium]|jgi:hypothetical protein|nr:hypothetical protein [Bacteroidales bacterium]